MHFNKRGAFQRVCIGCFSKGTLGVLQRVHWVFFKGCIGVFKGCIGSFAKGALGVLQRVHWVFFKECIGCFSEGAIKMEVFVQTPSGFSPHENSAIIAY